MKPRLVVTVGDPVVVETTVSNESDRPGATRVFLFIRDLVASVARPVLELKRFERVELGAGQRRKLTFRLERRDFGFLGIDMQPVIEPGEIQIHVGFSADPSGLRATKFRLP